MIRWPACGRNVLLLWHAAMEVSWCVGCHRAEEVKLAQAKRQAARDADGDLTPEMTEDVKLLLQLFGVPYLVGLDAGAVISVAGGNSCALLPAAFAG